jgi:hypothetical protein
VTAARPETHHANAEEGLHEVARDTIAAARRQPLVFVGGGGHRILPRSNLRQRGINNNVRPEISRMAERLSGAHQVSQAGQPVAFCFARAALSNGLERTLAADENQAPSLPGW